MKKYYRKTANALIGGVCSGLANYFNIKVVIVRAIWLVFICPLIIPYLLIWIVVPNQQF